MRFVRRVVDKPVQRSTPLRLAAGFGWGGLALVVLMGALSSGISGAAGMFGLFVLVVATVGLVRGRVRWAHLRRVSSLLALAVAMAAFVLSGLMGAAQDTSAVSQHLTRPHHTVPTSPAPRSPAPVAAPAAHRQLSTAAAASTPVKRHDHRTPRPTPKPSPTHRHTPPHHTAATVGDVVTAAGVVLPSRARTPGALNPAVTQATISRTICVSGWTSTVRPSSSVTTRLKIAQLTSGYAYKGDRSTSDYEEDHLISLELGGAPSDPRNLWPEPYSSREGARTKDLIENRLHALVCNHTISLATAQRAIATNWWTAYQRYGGSAYTTSSHPVHTSPPSPKPAAVAPGGGATARCADGTYSYAAHHQGACSHHGGVQTFYR